MYFIELFIYNFKLSQVAIDSLIRSSDVIFQDFTFLSQ